jgi:hypothetical protein
MAVMMAVMCGESLLKDLSAGYLPDCAEFWNSVASWVSVLACAVFPLFCAAVASPCNCVAMLDAAFEYWAGLCC